MAFRVVVCAVGIYFMEDALILLKKYMCSLHEACLHHLKTKQKSSVVRKVGCYVTWIHAPRLHVIFREELKEASTSEDCCSLKCYNLCDTSSEGPRSSEQLENRIEELEKELLRLQAQVSNILLKSEAKVEECCSDFDEIVVSSTSAVQPSIPTPPSLPPPPPPPPPLPPTPLIQTRTLLVKVKPKSDAVVQKNSSFTIMEELSKRPPKLRHVERSPGGRPIRTAPASTDPSDILAAVLRKRFEVIHGEKQECYMTSPENSPMNTLIITGH